MREVKRKSEMRLDIGRRVVGHGDYCGVTLDDREGVIVTIDSDSRYGVRFDEEDRLFHHLGGHCTNKHGFWCRPCDIEFIDDPSVDYSALGSLDALLL